MLGTIGWIATSDICTANLVNLWIPEEMSAGGNDRFVCGLHANMALVFVLLHYSYLYLNNTNPQQYS